MNSLRELKISLPGSTGKPLDYDIGSVGLIHMYIVVYYNIQAEVFAS